MTDFKQLQIERPIDDGQALTDDDIYWGPLSTSHPTTLREYGPVTTIDISPTRQQWISITDSTRVQIYSPDTLSLVRSFYSFKDTAYCGSFRSDGRLVCAGSKDGIVRVFDFETRTQLRHFKEHQGSPVHCTQFSRDKTYIFTGSDDRTVRVFDLATEKQLTKFDHVHTDYVRALTPGSTTNPHLLLSGSYDRTMKLIDRRMSNNDNVLMNFDHGDQIESVLMYANETLAITAGGLYLKVWDLLGGGRLLASLSNHHKSILCTGFTSEQNYILSGGLDRHVKIYDASTFRVVQTITYPDAVLSLAMVGPNDRALCVGMPGGLWSVKRRDGKQQISSSSSSSIPMNSGYESIKNDANNDMISSNNNSLVPIDDESTNDTKSTASSGSRKTKSRRRFFPSGIITPTTTDSIASANRRPRLAPYDNYLRKFRASAALDAAFTTALKRRQPDIVLALFKELSRRQMLKQALAGRDDLSLLKILRFLQKHIAHTTYMPVLIEVAHLISYLYDFSIASHSDKNNKAMDKLKRTIHDELQFQLELMKTKGVIEIILAASSSSTTTLAETDLVSTTTSNNNNNNTVISSL
ncbi:unnamed protein product [Adineta steineri]|uniref:U3 small nucleolar RNA-associated protein 15 homolog n=1 Tax=Adineta steineri TaxID=433720 RepID=A0A819GVY0_9BILA|nr:unnamed protein product [Adineta steineri]CAF3892172.1 unnamed protein product [Adineta steineri]